MGDWEYTKISLRTRRIVVGHLAKCEFYRHERTGIQLTHLRYPRSRYPNISPKINRHSENRTLCELKALLPPLMIPLSACDVRNYLSFPRSIVNMQPAPPRRTAVFLAFLYPSSNSLGQIYNPWTTRTAISQVDRVQQCKRLIESEFQVRNHYLLSTCPRRPMFSVICGRELDNEA